RRPRRRNARAEGGSGSANALQPPRPSRRDRRRLRLPAQRHVELRHRHGASGERRFAALGLAHAVGSRRMEVRSVWVTSDKVEADGACEALRAHGIKCDSVEPTVPYLPGAYTSGRAEINVVVALEDEERANDVLDEWAALLGET